MPSGELFSVPLHAVCVDGAPLIVRNAVFYAPSASVLRYCVRRRPRRGAATRGAAVFGDPWWDLEHAAEEAEKVAQILGLAGPVLGLDVTRERWFEAMSTKDILHFAGHAEFKSTDPLASCLYLAGDETVTARELFALPFSPIRLVTLSGCETGLSFIHPGDEPLGLTRALLYAGASSLVLTLWRVDDASSTALLTAFYRRWLHDGETKVDALRLAQCDVLASGVTNPYYWAPLVLIGDWY